MRTYRVKIVVSAGDKGPDEYAEANLPTVQGESAAAVIADAIAKHSAPKSETAIEQHERLVAVQNANAEPKPSVPIAPAGK